ncbi:MAG TPA: LptA/OstA family protein [Vulgatibacter sp.]|nr:LptA/OstA family protein [Vulgatibacter sp.]
MRAALLLALLASTSSEAVEEARAMAPQEIDLVSETLVVEHKLHRATFGGGVIATRGDLEVRCPTVVAHYDKRAKIREVVCEGPVSATQGGKTMTSQAGSFDNATGMLHLEGGTTLVEAGRRFSGERLDFDVGTSLATLSRGQADLPGSEDLGPLRTEDVAPFRITADKVTHDFDERRTTFAGNVEATRGDLVMRASRLVVVGAGDGKVERAWTEGGPVRVEQGERRGSARRGTFLGGGQRLVLEGDPVVTERDSSLRGDRVIFHVGEGRVEVERPRAVFPLDRARRAGE